MGKNITSLERKVVRNFFEQRGTFEDIEYVLGSTASKFSENDLYETLGFKSTNKYSAKDLFLMRKKFYETGSTDANLAKEIEENDIQLNLEFAPQKFEHKEYTRLLYSYLKISRNNIVGDIDIREMLYNLGNENLSHIRKTFESEEFIALMEELMPKFKYKEGCKPAVMLGTLYHNTKLSKKDINIIKSQAIKAMVFNTFDIAEIYRITLKSTIKDNITDIADLNPDLYRKVLDTALYLGLTVEELFNKCGLRVVNYVEQYKKFNVAYKLTGNKYIRLYVKDAELGIPLGHFSILFNNDLLGYLDTDESNRIIVTKGRVMPLLDLLGVNK